jgi:Flp pilus assembly protein TadB
MKPMNPVFRILRSLSRRGAKVRFSRLIERDAELASPQILVPEAESAAGTAAAGAQRLLAEAGITVAPKTAAFAGAAALAAAALPGIFAASIPLALLLPAVLIWIIGASIDGRRYRRGQEFNADFPSIALAVASSLRVGLSPLAALERSAESLHRESLVRRNVQRLNEALQKGASPDQALQSFGAGIALPELSLFRRGFSLVLRHGGRFSPTLERLAQVGRDRASLVQAAETSTATMRMTAHTLLALTPFILFILSFRRKDFWQILFTNPAAQTLGFAGATILAASYLALRWMSRLRL